MTGTSFTEPSAWRTMATVSARVLRSVSACALPRPSATASAKLANSTVNHSHTATRAAKPSVSRMARKVVRTLPSSTTNMTGLRAMVPRVELDEGVDDRPLHDGGVEQRGRRSASSA